MPTVQEVLKNSGWTDEQIAALDAKATEGLTNVLSTADQIREAAELKERKISEYMSTQVTPALNNWASEKARIEAENAYYRKLAEEAKAGGFVGEVTPPGSPTLDASGQPRNPQTGQFVAGQNPVPGSPGFDPNRFQEGVGALIGSVNEVSWNYQRLFGSVLPDNPNQLILEAREQRLPLKEYVAKKYNFAAKEQELATKREQEREANLTKTIEERVRREYAERGANPGLRPAEASSFAQVQKAVQAGNRPDPTMQTEAQRRATTRENIAKDLSEAQVQ
jgi:hypothetical protein